MADILALTHNTTDMETLMAAGGIREAFFGPPCPVTTRVEIRRPYRPELLVEITAIAAIPVERFKVPVRPGASWARGERRPELTTMPVTHNVVAMLTRHESAAFAIDRRRRGRPASRVAPSGSR
jgi:hypothetical protein